MSAWTEEELATLRQNAHMGAKAVAAMLPARNLNAIYQKCNKLSISLRRTETPAPAGEPASEHCAHVDDRKADPAYTDCGADPCDLVGEVSPRYPMPEERVVVDLGDERDLRLKLIDTKLALATAHLLDGNETFDIAETITLLDRARELVREVAS